MSSLTVVSADGTTRYVPTPPPAPSRSRGGTKTLWTPTLPPHQPLQTAEPPTVAPAQEAPPKAKAKQVKIATPETVATKVAQGLQLTCTEKRVNFWGGILAMRGKKKARKTTSTVRLVANSATKKKEALASKGKGKRKGALSKSKKGKGKGKGAKAKAKAKATPKGKGRGKRGAPSSPKKVWRPKAPRAEESEPMNTPGGGSSKDAAKGMDAKAKPTSEEVERRATLPEAAASSESPAKGVPGPGSKPGCDADTSCSAEVPGKKGIIQVSLSDEDVPEINCAAPQKRVMTAAPGEPIKSPLSPRAHATQQPWAQTWQPVPPTAPMVGPYLMEHQLGSVWRDYGHLGRALESGTVSRSGLVTLATNFLTAAVHLPPDEIPKK